MIRKSLTVFFILLANIILLAHAVIPHHHHKSDICIVDSKAHANSVAHTNCTEHNHHSDQEADNCSLNQVVVILSQQFRPEIKCFDCADNHSQSDGIHAVLLNTSLDPLLSTDISNIKPPLLLFIYSSFAGTSIGLRAPPFV